LNQTEKEIAIEMGKLSKDPYRWVLFSFPWGEGDLAEYEGPDDWQTKVLGEIRDGLKTVNEAILEAISSGHGVGKSALVSWLILWALSTFEDTRGVVTANTENQLKSKTWAELAKWHRLFIAKHWFELTATAIYSTAPAHEKTWRIDMVPWSIEKTEAFAGLHNKGKRIIVIFDEASSIHDKIFEVTEGALTDKDTEIVWAVFGNPTRNVGRFKDCFGKFRHRWKHHHVDARTVKITNKDQIQKWADDYGENSDFFKIRVKGEFPNASSRQFIPGDVVDAARTRKLQQSQYSFAPKILTCDPAWEGGDEIVIGLRQGLLYRQLAVYQKNDNDMVIAGYLAKFEDDEKANAVFIDFGYGTGIYSAGKTMGRNWTLVEFGSASSSDAYQNKRAEMWGLTKEWLASGGAIPDDSILADDLTGPEYEIVLKTSKIVIESKQDMKSRGLASPNRGDALALSFAFPVLMGGANKSYMHPIYRKDDKNKNPYAGYATPMSAVAGGSRRR
jgi:hypothetical protein